MSETGEVQGYFESSLNSSIIPEIRFPFAKKIESGRKIEIPAEVSEDEWFNT